MTMTTRSSKRTPRPSSDTVTVTVTDPHLVYHDGEQRNGTLHNVPADTAEHWQRHGWAAMTTTPDKASTKPADKAGD